MRLVRPQSNIGLFTDGTSLLRYVKSMAGDYITSEQRYEGLDRATHGVYHNSDRHLVSPLQKDDSSSTDSGEGRFRHLSTRLKHVKKKTNLLFHPSLQKKTADEYTDIAPLLAPPPVTQDQDDRLFHDAPEQKGPDFKEVLKNPISTVQSALHGASGAKFAETMDNQVIAHGAEVRLARAYDELKDAASDEQKVKAADNLEDLKKARQDSFVRWTLDRHVLTVRRVPPRTVPWPKPQDFKAKAEDGKTYTQWTDYGHHVRDHIHIPCTLALESSMLRALEAEHCAAPTLSHRALWRSIH